MKILNVTQGSPEWHAARAGIVTASELDKIISPTGKIRTGATPDGYLARKLAERWLGRPVESGSSWAMEQGSLREVDVVALVENRLEVDVQRVGFVTTDDGFFGCSPDGMIGENTGLEAKCPQPEAHMRYLTAGELPEQYAMQVHGGMAVTGATSWYFTSHYPGLPWFVLKVERDEAIVAAILDAVSAFRDRMDTWWASLVAKHGPPPERKAGPDYTDTPF